MKKKVLLLVLALVLMVSCFAGCTTDRVFTREIAGIDALKVATGSDFNVPNIVLTKGKFFDPDEYKDTVSIPDGVKKNLITLVYIPYISTSEQTELAGKLDTKAYRYCIQFIEGPAEDGVYKNGSIEFYFHGTNYNRVKGEDADRVKLATLEERKSALENINKGEEFASNIEGDVYKYSNKADKEIIRYFANSTKSTSYEATAYIRVDETKVTEGITDAEAKKTAINNAYAVLEAEAIARLDAMIAEIKG